MTRDQALAIVENIRLIEHFAFGGEVLHPSSNYKKPCSSILLTNLRSGEDVLYRIGRMPAASPDAVEEHRVA